MKCARILAVFLSLLIASSQGWTQALSSYKGQVYGYDVKNRDGIFDFSLVLPTVSKDKILDFDLSTYISSETDVLRALGQRIEVPSNLSVPNQTERYLFFNVNLNKPSYRLPQTTRLNYLGALKGEFRFKQVIDKVQSGSALFTLINDFNFSSYSLVKNPNTTQNIKASEHRFTHGRNYRVKNDYKNSYTSLAISFHEENEDQYFPIDLKQLSEDTNTLLKITDSHMQVVALVPKSVFEVETLQNTQRELTYSLAWNYTNNDYDSLLPILENYVRIGNTGLSVSHQSLNTNNNILGYKISLLNSRGQIISTEQYTGDLTEFVPYPPGSGVSKIRLDVYASRYDTPKFLLNTRSLLDYTDFVSRYEKVVR